MGHVRAMLAGDHADRDIDAIEIAFNRDRFELRDEARVVVSVVEDIRELFDQTAHEGRMAVGRDRFAGDDIKRPQVVDAVHMIRVVMSIKYGINFADALGQGLLP